MSETTTTTPTHEEATCQCTDCEYRRGTEASARLVASYRARLERLAQRGLLKPRQLADLEAGFADGVSAGRALERGIARLAETNESERRASMLRPDAAQSVATMSFAGLEDELGRQFHGPREDLEAAVSKLRARALNGGRDV